MFIGDKKFFDILFISLAIDRWGRTTYLSLVPMSFLFDNRSNIKIQTKVLVLITETYTSECSFYQN